MKKSIFAELRRRNVFKVASVYLIASWLVLQIIAVLAPYLKLPDLFGSIVTVVLIIAFPFACIITWAFELTPVGVKLSKDVEHNQSISHETGGKINTLLAVALFCALAVILIQFYQSGADSSDNKSQSIAVLPFRDMSPDQSQEYFGDGMAEEILNALARLDKLLVISRTSSFAFKDTDKGISEIGRTLNVDYILEGAIRKDRDTVRVTANLIEVETGAQVWSEAYERNLEGIFTIQKELTFAITSAMKLNLLQEEISIPTGMTQNSQAYDLFIQAREFQNKREVEAIASSITLLHRSLELDPDFHLAIAQLYISYYLAEYYGGASQETIDEKLDELFWRILDAPEFGLKYAVLSIHAQRHAPKNDTNDIEFSLMQKAYDLAPHDGFISHAYSSRLSSKFSLEAAIDSREQILLADPYNVINYSALANLYIRTGRFKALYDVQSKIIDIAPDSFEAFDINEIIHYVYEKNIDLAISKIRDFSDKNSLIYQKSLANLLAISGQVVEASSIIIQQFEKDNSVFFINSYFLLYLLHQNEALNNEQTKAFERVKLPAELSKDLLAALLSLLSGDAQPYLNIMQRTNFSNQKLIDSKGPYNNDVELIAAIRKQSGDDSLAKDLMHQTQNQNRVVQCLKYPEAVNPDCLLWLYLDGKLTQEQQFTFFKNSLQTLTKFNYGDEIFMLTSPMYYGVNSHPDFIPLAQDFLSKTFPNFKAVYTK